MSRLILPEGISAGAAGERDLVEALEAELNSSEIEANLHLVTWKIVDAYLAGVRRFKVLDRWSGNLSIAFENYKGELDLRYEDVVRRYLVECGRYLRGDLSPVVDRVGETLGALRRSGIANAVLMSATSRIPLAKFNLALIRNFIKFGIVGVSHYETGDPDMPDMLQIVPPRQLRGLPAWADGLENLWGICRKRWVPLPWIAARVKAITGKNLKFNNARDDLFARDVPWGAVAPGYTVYEGTGPSIGTSYVMPRVDLIGDLGNKNYYNNREKIGMRPQQQVDKTGRLYVPLEEITIFDDSGEYTARYIVKIGRRTPIDENFEEKGVKMVPNLHIARHTDTGRFFSRGFIHPLIPFNDQIEKMMANLFKNIAELDTFGTLFVSGQMGIDMKKWRTGPRPKIDKYEPDPLNPTAQPFNLAPSNAGMLPARVVETATSWMDRLSGQGPIFQAEASGRTESAAAHGFLFNIGNISMGMPAHNLADAMTGVYSRILQATRDRTSPGDKFELPLISDAIAGVIINPETGMVELTDNPIPQPWEVKIDVRDRTPKDRGIRKMELKEEYAAGRVDFVRYWITVFEEQLDIPGAPRDMWETWRKAQYQIVVLFRDGKQPGPLFLGEHVQNPQIQLLAVQQFMNRIEFSLASKEVRAQFEQWKEALESLAGIRAPAGFPLPEEAAQQEMAMLQQQQAAGAGGTPI